MNKMDICFESHTKTDQWTFNNKMSIFDLHYHYHCRIPICSLSINTASIYTYIAQKKEFFLIYLQCERIEEKQKRDGER